MRVHLEEERWIQFYVQLWLFCPYRVEDGVPETTKPCSEFAFTEPLNQLRESSWSRIVPLDRLVQDHVKYFYFFISVCSHRCQIRGKKLKPTTENWAVLFAYKYAELW